MRGRDDARVDLDRLGAADGPHLLLLQHAQQLDLQAHRHVADLVEQQRAAVRGLEQALVRAVGARERAFDVAEQLGLEQVLGHRAAVDRDERLVLARARAVNRAREQLLAGARFARDQHARVGVRDHARLLQARFHGRAARDDLGAPLVGALRHARHFHGALDVLEQLLLVDGLRQEAERAALRRLDGIGNRAVRREQQHAEARPLALDLLQQLDAVHVVHAQVGDDEIGPETRQRGERFGRALDGLDVVVLGPQADAQQAQQAGVVVDQQDSTAQRRCARGLTVNLDHFRVPESIVRCW